MTRIRDRVTPEEYKEGVEKGKVSRTGIFHVLFALFFLTLMVTICQEHGIFRTFSCYFSQLSVLLYAPTFFSLSFTLQRKDKTRAIDLKT